MQSSVYWSKRAAQLRKWLRRGNRACNIDLSLATCLTTSLSLFLRRTLCNA